MKMLSNRRAIKLSRPRPVSSCGQTALCLAEALDLQCLELHNEKEKQAGETWEFTLHSVVGSLLFFSLAG